jgi:heptosyltransferase-2
VLPWEGLETAALLAGESASGRLSAALAAADVVLAFTRSEPLMTALQAHSTRVVARDPSPPAEGPHASAWLARALLPLGVCVDDPPPPLDWSEADHRDARVRTRHLPPCFVAVHPGSGSPAKTWPADRFATVARQLAAGHSWLLVLGPAEADVPTVEGALLARDWPVRTLGAALSRAGLYLGNDSGVSHLAAASGAPTLALFGPTDNALWSPVGPRVATLRAASGLMADLAADDVAGAAQRLVPGASPCRPERAD